MFIIRRTVDETINVQDTQRRPSVSFIIPTLNATVKQGYFSLLFTLVWIPLTEIHTNNDVIP